MKAQFYNVIIKKLMVSGLIFIVCNTIKAQTNTFPSTGAAGIGTTTPNASSLLEINSTGKGFLMPRMTQAQRNAIASPVKGLMIYQTNNTQGFYFYNGSSWMPVTPAVTSYTAGQGISISNGVISNLGDLNSGDDITINTAAGGDLVGTYPSPTVAKLHGITLYPVAPINGQVLKYNGTYWLPSTDDNTTYTAGSGLSLSGTTFSNTAPDQTVSLTGDGATTITGTYPNFTISSTDNNTTYTAGSGLSLSGTTFTNTAPDQTVSIGAGPGIIVIGTYPNFAISSTITQGWSLTGNSGTNPASNFIGTTDAQSLVFKVNNNKGGYIDYVDDNTSFGYEGLFSITSGFANTAVGYKSLLSNSDGYANTAIGNNALYQNTNGQSNTAQGASALYNNTTGSNNTGIGESVLVSNTKGSNNVAIGVRALLSNATGNNNTANGRNALYSNITGYSNVAVGTDALINNMDRSNLIAVGDSALYNNGTSAVNSYDATGNTAVGSKALYLNTSGYFNTAMGFNALMNSSASNSNTAMGYFALRSNAGNQNTAMGAYSLSGNTAGASNTAIGYNSLNNNTNGNSNTAIGFYSLIANTSGISNTAVGDYALLNNTNGSYNTAVGDQAGPNNVNYYGSTAIGRLATTTSSYQVRVGDESVTSIGGYTNWTNISDGRVKKNIKQNVPGLAFINKLQPITYNLNLDAADKIIQRPQPKDKDGKSIVPTAEELTARRAKETIVYSGFVAQDVEKAAKSLNFNFSGVDAAKNDKDLYGLRYSDFVIPLVKAVQELSKMNDVKEARIDTLQKQFNDLKALVLSIQQKQNQCSPCSASVSEQTQSQSITLSDASSLQQNIPNPFTHTTIIGYSLPQKFTSAQIIITDKNGKTLKTVNVSGVGKGSLKVDASTLASGAYQYSLVVDGRLIDTKQMVLAR